MSQAEMYKQLDNAILLLQAANASGDGVTAQYAEEAILKWQKALGLK